MPASVTTDGLGRTMSTAVTTARARLAALVRKAPPHDPRIPEARAALDEALFIDRFEKLLGSAPPISGAQRRELADRLLRG